MPLITHIKAHAFHNLNAAIRLANENPSAKNTALLQKLTGVRNSHNEIPQKIGDAILKQQRVLLI